jgi:hypothetical protein
MSSSSDGFEIPKGVDVRDITGKIVDTVGHRYTLKQSSFLSIIVLIIALTVGGAVLMSGLEVEQIKSDWANRRCEPSVMFSAFMFKPTGYPGSSFSFSADNFDFCINNVLSRVFDSIMSIFIKVAGKQTDAVSGLSNVQNMIQNMIANAVRSFQNAIDPFYKTYKAGIAQVARISHAIQRSLQRTNATLTGLLYSGISMLYAVINSVNFAIKVVVIMLAILAALVIILFLFFLPAIPVILAAIATLVGVGVAVGGYAEVFCFAGDTPVILYDKTVCPISELSIGMKLSGGGTVEGMYTFDGSGAALYSINGIHVTADHLVWHNGSWIAVKDCPAATVLPESVLYKTLYCPVISNRCIPVSDSSKNTVWFRDWEELDAEDEEGYTVYDELCSEILNGYKSAAVSTPVNTGLISPTMTVLKRLGSEKVACQIKDISIGDYIFDKELGDYVCVKGVMCNEIRGVSEVPHNNWITDGIWYKNGKGIWTHPTEIDNIIILDSSYCGENTNMVMGFNLVVEGGEFTLYDTMGRSKLQVKDALEVGHRISDTYEYVLSRIENKVPPME